jgi:hypothetical protein
VPSSASSIGVEAILAAAPSRKARLRAPRAIVSKPKMARVSRVWRASP